MAHKKMGIPHKKKFNSFRLTFILKLKFRGNGTQKEDYFGT